MTVRELIKRLLDAPPDSEMRIKNLDGTTRPMTLVGFHDEDGTETALTGDSSAIVFPTAGDGSRSDPR